LSKVNPQKSWGAKRVTYPLALFMAFSQVAAPAYSIPEAALETPGLEVAPQVSLEVVFSLKEFASVAEERLYLGEIASCEGYERYCEESYSIDLGLSPQPGQSTRLTRAQLESTLKSEMPEVEVRVVGAEQVVINALYQEIESDEVAKALQDAFDRSLAAYDNTRVEVRSLRMPRSLRLRSGSYQIVFPDLEHNGRLSLEWILAIYRGASAIRVQVISGGESPTRTAADLSLHAQISIEQRVPVAMKALQANQILKADDFDLRWVQVSRSYISYITSFSDLVGMKLKRAVRVGSPVTIQQIELPSAVRRGELVKIHMRGGNIQMNLQGKAMRSAAIGERVEVEHQVSKQRLHARVIGPSEVEVIQ